MSDIIAACGLNCSRCDIFRLTVDIGVQDKLLPFFRSRGWLKEGEGIETVIEKNMYCKGCNIDKAVFWSEGCKIASCCKDEKGFATCANCNNFGCGLITEHAKQGGKYEDAYNFLLSLRK